MSSNSVTITIIGEIDERGEVCNHKSLPQRPPIDTRIIDTIIFYNKVVDKNGKPTPLRLTIYDDDKDRWPFHEDPHTFHIEANGSTSMPLKEDPPLGETRYAINDCLIPYIIDPCPFLF